MKKSVKLSMMLMLIVISLAAISAFTLPQGKAECEYYPQYFWDGVQLRPVSGTYGEDWLCDQDPGICTFWLNPWNNKWEPCHYGIYTEISR